MPKLGRDLTAGNLHPREDIFATANLGSINAEIVIPSDGCSTVGIDLRGTFNMQLEVAGSVDGVNWTLIPVKPVNQAAKKYVAIVAGAVPGLWVGKCALYRFVRVRTTAWTSGTVTATLIATSGLLDDALDGRVTTDVVTNTGAAAAAVTLTLPAPGIGLRQYLTYLSISRINATAAALTGAAGPLNVSTTNIPGTVIFAMSNDALAAGVRDPWREDFAYPIAATAQNTAVTIVCPATTGVIWRATAGYYVAP